MSNAVTHKACRLVCVVAAALAPALPAVAAQTAADDKDWVFSTSLYLWAADTHLGVAGLDDINVPAEDTLDVLDAGFMGSVGVAKGDWGAILDLMYISTKDKSNGALNLPGGTLNFNTEERQKTFTSSLLGAYRVLETETDGLSLGAGVRYLNLQGDLDLDVPALPALSRSVSGSADYWDGIVSVLGRRHIYDRWNFRYEADYGRGDSEKTWQALGRVSYSFDSFDAIVGYRYLTWSFDSSSNKLGIEELTLKGPYLGVNFTF